MMTQLFLPPDLQQPTSGLPTKKRPSPGTERPGGHCAGSPGRKDVLISPSGVLQVSARRAAPVHLLQGVP
jgi:hypothetical protein